MLWVKAVVSTCFRSFLSHILLYMNSSCGKIKTCKQRTLNGFILKVFLLLCKPFPARIAVLRQRKETAAAAATLTDTHKQVTLLDTKSDDVMMLFL